ncbi:MAG TPA: ATP-binding protein [Dictyobacter sp.]|nr:ATP-binding protein [Dictyobacter sp.]
MNSIIDSMSPTAQKVHTSLSLVSSLTARSLRTRLVLWNMMVLLLIFLILGSLIVIFVPSYLISTMDTRLQVQRILLQNFTHAWEAGNHPFNGTFQDSLVKANEGNTFTETPIYIKLLDPTNGQLLKRSADLGQVRLPVNQADVSSAQQGKDVLSTIRDNEHHQVRILTFPIHDTYHHTVVIAQVAQSLNFVDQVRNVLLLLLGIGGGCIVLIASWMEIYLINRELRPLHLLVKNMQDLNVQELGKRLPFSAQASEIRTLTRAFNQMSERLQASFSLQRDFLADVSHELRTPLTALKGQIDVLLLNPALQEDARQDAQLIHAEIERLTRLINSLLFDARAEVGLLPQLTEERLQTIELDELCIKVARQARFLNQEVAIKFEELQQVSTVGDPDLLKEVCFNIVDNALRYSRPGDTVLLSVTSVQALPASAQRQRQEHGYDDGEETYTWAKVTIRDTGPGINPIDLPHIFERHYRSQQLPARTRHGSGLGLAIASLIVRMHHGAITVESEVGKGTTFTIWLPTMRTVKATIS